LLQKSNSYADGVSPVDLQSKSRRALYFCRFVYWIGPDFTVGFENPEDAGAGAGFGFLGFLASLLLLI